MEDKTEEIKLPSQSIENGKVSTDQTAPPKVSFAPENPTVITNQPVKLESQPTSLLEPDNHVITTQPIKLDQPQTTENGIISPTDITIPKLSAEPVIITVQPLLSPNTININEDNEDLENPNIQRRRRRRNSDDYGDCCCIICLDDLDNNDDCCSYFCRLLFSPIAHCCHTCGQCTDSACDECINGCCDSDSPNVVHGARSTQNTDCCGDDCCNCGDDCCNCGDDCCNCGDDCNCCADDCDCGDGGCDCGDGECDCGDCDCSCFS